MEDEVRPRVRVELHLARHVRLQMQNGQSEMARIACSDRVSNPIGRCAQVDLGEPGCGCRSGRARGRFEETPRGIRRTAQVARPSLRSITSGETAKGANRVRVCRAKLRQRGKIVPVVVASYQ